MERTGNERMQVRQKVWPHLSRYGLVFDVIRERHNGQLKQATFFRDPLGEFSGEGEVDGGGGCRGWW